MLPRGRRYITTQCRFLLGMEEMHLQSLWFDDSLLQRFDNNLLCSLAGNAFEVSCCSAVVFTALLLLSAGIDECEPVPRPIAVSGDLDDGCSEQEEARRSTDDLRNLWRGSKRVSNSFLEEGGDDSCYVLKSARLRS